MYHGIINVYKEKGYTSHDVVAKLRGIAGQKKIGHTGTLDPDAEGVLPICLGNATKVCDLLTDKEKAYRAVLLLGVCTDTQDISGAVLEQKSTKMLNPEMVCDAVRSMIGPYEQIPPMYSAIKVNGKKLYELAREGKVIERKARPVVIHDIRILRVELPRVEMEVTCSKGTYIRTLCHDIGEKLGCGGCMETLLRTRSGRFSMDTSIRLSDIERKKTEGKFEELLLPVDQVFEELPEIRIERDLEKKLKNGNPFAVKTENGAFADGENVRVYDADGTLAAVYRYVEAEHWFRPVKMFMQ